MISALRGSGSGSDSGSHSALQTLVSSVSVLPPGSVPPKSSRIRPKARLVYDFELE